MEYNDANGRPIVSGLYRHKNFSDRLLLVNLERNSYEIISAILAETKLKGKISDRVKYYFQAYKPVSIQAYIEHYQRKVDFFKSKLEQLTHSSHPFGEWHTEGPLPYP